MRFYGKKFLRQAMRKQAEGRIESRNAILWSMEPDERTCLCKIQGSNEYVKAYFPRNWQFIPEYLKKGNAIRITHTGGVRGRIEVSGHGLLIPSPVEGGGEPTPDTPGDGVLSGLTVNQIPQGDWMKVYVKTGTVQFGGVTYTIGPMTMDSGTAATMDMTLLMNDIAAVLNIDAAPGSGYRYDLIVIGSDLVIDVVKGTASSSSPVFPSTPGGHILLGWILLHEGMTEITQANINKYWSTPVPCYMAVEIVDTDLSWTEYSTNVECIMMDQYGNGVSIPGEGWYITLTFESGNGTISFGGQSSTTSLSAYSGWSPSVTFTYTRNATVDDVSPRLVATCTSGQSSFQAAGFIILRDELDNIMV